MKPITSKSVERLMRAFGVSRERFAERLGMPQDDLDEILDDRKELQPEQAERFGQMLNKVSKSMVQPVRGYPNKR